MGGRIKQVEQGEEAGFVSEGRRRGEQEEDRRLVGEDAELGRGWRERAGLDADEMMGLVDDQNIGGLSNPSKIGVGNDLHHPVELV